MTRLDRVLLVTALVAALVAVILHVHRPASAFASGSGSELGPTDALLLTDRSSKASNDLRVRAESGRIVWSDRPTGRAWSLGAVNVDRTMKALLAGSTYATRRDELDGEARDQDEEFAKRFEELRQRYANVDPKSPEWPKANEDLERLRSEYMAWREGSIRIREKFFAEQIEQAYRELVSAVELVAERGDVDLVLRFMPTANAFEAENLGAAREQVIGRTFLKYPEAIDLTDEVLRELGVKD